MSWIKMLKLLCCNVDFAVVQIRSRMSNFVPYLLIFRIYVHNYFNFSLSYPLYFMTNYL